MFGKPKILISTVLTIIIALSLVQVIISNSLSTTGVDLSKINTSLADYKKENAILSEKILLLSSYFTIASKAGELGYTGKRNEINISSSLPIASRR